MLKKLFLFAFIFVSGFLLASNSNAVNNNKFDCGQNLDGTEKLNFLSSHNRYSELKFYNLPEDKTTINNTDLNQIAYIFWQHRFIGHAVYINDKVSSKLIKEYLYNSLGYPNEGDQKFKTWHTEDEIIIFTKFSLHQARVLYICKNMGIELKKIFDEVKTGIGPHY